MLTRIATLTAMILVAASASAQTVIPLKNAAPDGAGLGLLLTDGSVMYQGGGLADWYRLVPDTFGSYVNGSWVKAASLPAGYAPDAFSSAVMIDGRLVIAGGEYNNGNFVLTDECAVYDPKADTWTRFAPPAGWGFIGDSPSAVLPDGKLLLGRKLDMRVAALDPATLTWTELGVAGKRDFNAEEGWTLLPNGTVLTYDVKTAPHSEIYDPTTAKWLNAGSTVANLKSPPSVGAIGYGHGLVYHPPGEVGPGILRPDGTVFATGGTNKGGSFGHTAIYHPAANGGLVGTWVAGPNFPNGIDAGDNFAVLLPTGNVLVETNVGQLYEFDGASLTAEPASAGGGSILMLPSGEAITGGNAVYRAAGPVNPAWAPVVTNAPAVVTRGTTYPVRGRQFNGLSQAAAFGDEYQASTNYPLVRLINTASGHVVYARTHDHSTMAVATGAATVSTNFDVPAAAETGDSTLQVVANGIASVPVALIIR